MTGEKLLTLVDSLDFRRLFIEELGWNNPDQPPAKIELGDHEYEFTQAASYKGLRVWHCPTLPSRRVQRTLDELIGRTSHERLVIFSGEGRQEWRWPRRAQTSGANAKLLVHSHVDGTADPRLAEQLRIITLDLDEDVTLVALLERMRAAFDQEAEVASVQAARLMGSLYNALEVTGVEPVSATLLLARLLFLLFGDDGGMWRKDMFTQFVEGATSADTLHSDLTHLFEVLNTPESDRDASAGEVLSEFRYVNGGLYHDELQLPPLGAAFRDALLEACAFDWAIISPAVFGSMFQTVKDREARRRGGEHYTTENNILKTIGPLFLDDLQARLVDVWDDKKRLLKFHQELGELRFLDPACGCGNFLIVTYRELRALELELLKRLRDLDIEAGAVTAASRGQQSFDVTGDIKVTLDHFYGIEIEEWPARIAETAMLLVDHLANLRMEQDFGLAPDRLPIRIAPLIVHGNALEANWQEILPATDSTFVFGNPPFIGQKEKDAAQTADMKRVWGKDWDGYLDYVTGWHKKTIDYLAGTTRARFAFVTTNSITQGQPVASLFRPIFAAGWSILFAHRTFAWQSEAREAAAVHCVIIGFARSVPRPRIFDYARPKAEPHEIEAEHINPYLLDAPDVFVEKRTMPLSPSLPPVVVGSKATDWGRLTIGPDEYERVRADPIMAKYLRPLVGGDELINSLPRWCLWLVDMDPSEPARSPELRERLEAVRELRLKSNDLPTQAFAATPHLFTYRRQPSTDYLAIPNTFSEARRFMTVGRLRADTIAAIKLFTAEDPDGFLFAVFSSSMMLTWQKMVGGRIKSDPSFANTLVWNTLPFPAITADERQAIVAGGEAVLAARARQSGRTLAEMYEPTAMAADLIDAHDQLDTAVDAAFGFDRPPTLVDRQQRLFDRYTEMTTAGQLTLPTTRAKRPRRTKMV